MNDPALLVALSSTGLVAVARASAAALRGWSGWLELRRLELAGHNGGEPRLPSLTPARLELAELKERVRRLEAIASGTEA